MEQNGASPPAVHAEHAPSTLPGLGGPGSSPMVQLALEAIKSLAHLPPEQRKAAENAMMQLLPHIHKSPSPGGQGDLIHNNNNNNKVPSPREPSGHPSGGNTGAPTGWHQSGQGINGDSGAGPGAGQVPPFAQIQQQVVGGSGTPRHQNHNQQQGQGQQQQQPKSPEGAVAAAIAALDWGKLSEAARSAQQQQQQQGDPSPGN